MKSSFDFQNDIDKLKENLIEAILESLPENERVEFDDLYLGEYDIVLFGYPKVHSIAKVADDVIIEGDEDEVDLSDYTIEELKTLLFHIEKFKN